MTRKKRNPVLWGVKPQLDKEHPQYERDSLARRTFMELDVFFKLALLLKQFIPGGLDRQGPDCSP
jgi:hypothetical protein